MFAAQNILAGIAAKLHDTVIPSELPAFTSSSFSLLLLFRFVSGLTGVSVALFPTEKMLV